MINLSINGAPYQFESPVTLLEACTSKGIHIPTLCHLKNLVPSGSCRICVVEVDQARNLVPACAFPISEGMVVRTNTQRIREARKLIVEMLIANHPQDCLSCNRNLTCELQKLAGELGAEPKPHFKEKRKYEVDSSSPSIVRDPNKCIICGRCVRVCEEVQAVGAIDFTRRGFNTMVLPAFNANLADTTCVNCGQCVKVCPTGALSETFSVKEVIDALADPKRTVVAQVAPAVRVALGELFKVEEDNVAPKLVDALKRLGFKWVFDTNFAADLTIMEEGTELVSRLKGGGVLPMITSCSPGWIKFIEHFYPSMIGNLSTCKSPQQMQGSMIKNYWAKKMGLDPASVYVVSIMPCTAKKFEAQRPEMEVDGIRDVDAVLTTREAGNLIRAFDIDLAHCLERPFDNPLGESTGAGAIFGATGGVMEAALRTAVKLVTGSDADPEITAVRGFEGVKESEVKLGGETLRVAVCSGLGNARRVLEDQIAGRKNYHFIEIMACPGGCLNGGGQPLLELQALAGRLKKIYAIDRACTLRRSHENPYIQQLYKEFLGEPNSHLAHNLLHTHYRKRPENT